MLGAVLADLWPYIAAAVGAIAALLGVYAKGRRDAAGKAAHRAAEDHIETGKRVNAENYVDSDIDRVRERMRERGKR